ncbi:MAG TPA: PHB depolymerase family esterase [Mycobacteriales bacterium]|nr:PHB depolymerase family esterase [Mycobacteriales bacterium]
MLRRLRVSVVLAVVALIATLVPATATTAHGRQASFTYYRFSNSQGARKYMVYVPASYRPGMPLVVDLHGCDETARLEARRSRFNEVAARLGFVVAYPEQDPAANGSMCWNWFEPMNQTRGKGEPALIAGITEAVTKRWHTDPRRTYVFGISAGGGMSDIMAVTYPDLYAAAGVYAGCEYRGLPCLGSPPAQPWQLSAQLAYDEMGPRARTVPVFVVQGDQDFAVPFPNSLYVVQQWLNDDLLASHQSMRATYWNPDSTRKGKKPGQGGQSYDVTTWRGAGSCELAQMWLIHGMGHAWSNAPKSGDQQGGDTTDVAFDDPNGPDVTTPAAEFFLRHPMTRSDSRC